MIYSDAAAALRALRRGDRAARRHVAGRRGGRSPGTTRSRSAASAPRERRQRTALAAQADLVIGIGTRYSDFTTASRTAFQNPGVRFVNINVASFDAVKHGTPVPVVADAREALVELARGAAGYRVDASFEADYSREKRAWDDVVDEAFVPRGLDLPSQTEIIGAVNAATDPRDVLVCAAGSLPGDLHKLWRVRDDLGYHVEYAFSCMGYEIAGGIGVKRGLAIATRDVIVMVGDGSYLMMHTEIVTAVAEGIKFIVVLIQNHGYASIGHLSEDVGSQRFGTQYRFRRRRRQRVRRRPAPRRSGDERGSLGVEVIRIEPGAGCDRRPRRGRRVGEGVGRSGPR